MKNNLSKIFLLILPIIIFAFSNSAKADTFYLYYNDPSVASSNSNSSGYCTGSYGSTNCNSGNVTVVLNVNLDSGGYNTSTNSIAPTASISYGLCSQGSYGTTNCADAQGNYNGNISMSITGLSITATGQTDGQVLTLCGSNPTVNIGYGGGVNFYNCNVSFDNQGKPAPSQTQNYDLSWSFFPTLYTGSSYTSASYMQYASSYYLSKVVVHSSVFIPKVVKPANKAPNILVK
ncbi:MAG: hypothetical protein WCO35_02885 [Candidatus Nomurabacteria bacterium]